MSSKPYQRSRLIHLIVSIVILAAIIYIWSAFYDKMLIVLIPSLAIGFVRGRVIWRRLTRRVDKRNALILYFTDTVGYGLLIVLFLFSKVPLGKLKAILFLSDHPYILPVVIWFVAAVTVGYNLALYRGVRRFEVLHGPLRVKRFYARSALGAESLIGKPGVVRQTCQPRGTVKIESTIWNAESIDGSTIPQGTSVIVKDVEGLRVFVEPAP